MNCVLHCVVQWCALHTLLHGVMQWCVIHSALPDAVQCCVLQAQHPKDWAILFLIDTLGFSLACRITIQRQWPSCQWIWAQHTSTGPKNYGKLLVQCHTMQDGLGLQKYTYQRCKYNTEVVLIFFCCKYSQQRKKKYIQLKAGKKYLEIERASY